jgi:hypothetical protein
MTDIKTRAREIAGNVFGHPRFNRQPDAVAWRDALAEGIAAALLSAENEAYERAAKVVLVKCSSTPVEIATAIRALKTEET